MVPISDLFEETLGFSITLIHHFNIIVSVMTDDKVPNNSKDTSEI